MKKLFSMLLILCMIFSFSACGRSNDEDSYDDDDKESVSDRNDDDEDEDEKVSQDDEDEDEDDEEDEDKDVEEDEEAQDSEDDEDRDTGEDEEAGADEDEGSGGFETSNDDSDSSWFQSSDGMFGFNYPSDMMDLSSSVEGQVEFCVADSTGDNIVFMTEVIPDGYEGTVDDYMEANMTNIEDAYDISDVEYFEDRIGNNVHSRQVKYTLDSDGTKMDQLLVIVLGEDKGYLMTFTLVSDGFGAMKDSFIQPVLDSVVFNGVSN